MTKLERKWWFAGPVATLAVIVTRYLMDSVGIQHLVGWAELAIFIYVLLGCSALFQCSAGCWFFSYRRPIRQSNAPDDGPDLAAGSNQLGGSR